MSRKPSAKTVAPSEAASAAGARALWGAHFDTDPAEVMAQINPSIDFDRRLYAHDIAGSRAGNFHAVRRHARWGKEGSAIGRHQHFCGAFARAIGIGAAQGIVFAISPNLFPILVALIAGYHDDDAWA